MTTTTMGIRLDDETRTRLKNLGAVKDRSPHWLMKQAIASYLTREERYEREKAEDQDRYQEYLDTGKHITHEEMMAWLDKLAEQAARKAQGT